MTLMRRKRRQVVFFSEPAMRLAGAIEIFQALTSWLGRELRFFWGI